MGTNDGVDLARAVPAGGWVCFFCGEVCTTVGEAEDHFGLDGYEAGDAACIRRLTEDEKAINHQMMDMFRELEGERDAHMRTEERAQQAEYLAGRRDSEIESKFPGCRSVQDAWNMYDSMEGRAIASQAVLDRLGGWGFGWLVGLARWAVCR